MRKVMRESMYLLLAGQAEALVGGKPIVGEYALGYDDFTTLRPEIADSSWRGAMAKAKKNKWVVPLDLEGRTQFQMTRYGAEKISTDFATFKQLENASGTWTILLLQPYEGKRQQYAALQRELTQRGAAQLIPSLYAWPTEIYSQDLVNTLEKLGFFGTFFPVDPRKSRPSHLGAFWEMGGAHQKKKRNLSSISKDVSSLLAKTSSDKKLHHQQKRAIGGFLISGMSILSQFQWFEVNSTLLSTQIKPFAVNLDTLAAKYFES